MVVSCPGPCDESTSDSLISLTTELINIASDIDFLPADLESDDPDHPLHSTLVDDPLDATDPLEITPEPLMDLGYGGDHVGRCDNKAIEFGPMKVSPFEYAPFIENLWPNPSADMQCVAPLYHQLYSVVKESNLPNYLAAMVQVPSALNAQHGNKCL